MRRRRETRALFDVFTRTCDLPGFRVVHFSLQSNHMHLIVEACDTIALSRGMKGLLVRLARRLNKMWKRRGPVVAAPAAYRTTHAIPERISDAGRPGTDTRAADVARHRQSDPLLVPAPSSGTATFGGAARASVASDLGDAFGAFRRARARTPRVDPATERRADGPAGGVRH